MTDAQRTAEAVGAALSEKDTLSKTLGIRLVSIAPGKAVTEMTVTDGIVNGAAIAHGGAVFSLADTAFAHACNSANTQTFATHCSINFLRPGNIGDVLQAEANVAEQTGRSCIYDITVTNADGQTVAIFRGTGRQSKDIPIV